MHSITKDDYEVYLRFLRMSKRIYVILQKNRDYADDVSRSNVLLKNTHLLKQLMELWQYA